MYYVTGIEEVHRERISVIYTYVMLKMKEKRVEEQSH